MDPFMHYGIAAGVQAVADAGPRSRAPRSRPLRRGHGRGHRRPQHRSKSEHDAFLAGGPRKISPFYIPGSIINMLAGPPVDPLRPARAEPRRRDGLHHLDPCPGRGRALHPVWRRRPRDVRAAPRWAPRRPRSAASAQAKALSTRNDSPTTASRPWDRDRDGFVLSDGGGAMVLEEYEHARRRGARIYAELTGFGMSGDAYHITAPPEDGAGAAPGDAATPCAMPVSIPADVQYLNAHATSTPLGDRAEVVAIKDSFGDHAHKLAVSSTKSMTGHLLGAAGVRRGDLLRAGPARPGGAADDQPRESRSGLRPRLRAERGAPDAHRRGGVQLLRLRRHQWHPGHAPPPRLTSLPRA